MTSQGAQEVEDGLFRRPFIPRTERRASRQQTRRNRALRQLLRLRGGSVQELAVAGDTPSDIESGLRAGAGLVAGVLTGIATRADFEQAGAPLILDSIAGLLAHVTG